MTSITQSEMLPEPPWAELFHTILAIIIHIMLFLTAVAIGALGLDYMFRHSLRLEFGHGHLAGYPMPSYLSLLIAAVIYACTIWSKWMPTIVAVGHGNVQFIRCNIAGFSDITYKLNGGWHVLLPFFSKWKEEWHYDEAMSLTIKAFRVSVAGQDIIVNAEGMARMDSECLLVVHRMGSKDGRSGSVGIDSRRLFLIELLEPVLQQAIEEECARAFKKGHGLVFPGEDSPRELTKIEDLIECGNALEEKIKTNLFVQDLRDELGSIIEWFTLGNIDLPEAVAYQRDNNAAHELLDKKATEIADKDKARRPLSEIKKDAMIYAGAETRHDEKRTHGLDDQTLQAIGGIVSSVLRSLTRQNTPETPSQQTPDNN